MKALFLGTLAASQATPIINSSLPTSVPKSLITMNHQRGAAVASNRARAA